MLVLVAVTLVQLGGRLLDTLRALAFEDDEVTELIECFVAGCPDRSDHAAHRLVTSTVR